MFSESIVNIVEIIQFFPKDKTCLGFSRVKNTSETFWLLRGRFKICLIVPHAFLHHFDCFRTVFDNTVFFASRNSLLKID